VSTMSVRRVGTVISPVMAPAAPSSTPPQPVRVRMSASAVTATDAESPHVRVSFLGVHPRRI
jgi:hypothetical protein